MERVGNTHSSRWIWQMRVFADMTRRRSTISWSWTQTRRKIDSAIKRLHTRTHAHTRARARVQTRTEHHRTIREYTAFDATESGLARSARCRKLAWWESGTPAERHSRNTSLRVVKNRFTFTDMIATSAWCLDSVWRRMSSALDTRMA